MRAQNFLAREISGLIFVCCLFACLGLSAEESPIDSGLAIYRSNYLEEENRVYEGETYWWNGQPVQDKDALNGMAQWATPEKHKDAHEYVFCVGRETKLRAGRYKVIYRLKISAKPAKALPVCDILAYNHGGLNGQRLFSESKNLTTDDFKKAGVYQDFSLSFERYDISFAAIVVSWHKQVDIFVDRVTLVPEKYFSDDDFFSDTALRQNENLQKVFKEYRSNTDPGKRFLIVAGPYYRHYRFDEALKKITNGNADFCYAINDVNSGTYLKPEFPNPARLAGYDAVVLLDVPANPFHVTGRLALKEYVAGGGALFVSGGPFALGKGGYENTFLEEILPVTLENPEKFLPAGANNALTFSDDKITEGLFKKQKTVVGWYHRMGKKDGSAVLLQADGNPIMVLGKYGKGTVAVLSATPIGTGGPEERLLLESDDWPEFFARILGRLTEKK